MTYEAPKYPRPPFELDKRRKLTQEEITEMKEWRERGKTYKWIGEAFGVSAPTAHYHTDPEWAKALNQKRYKLLQKQYENDPDLLIKKRRQSNQAFLRKTKEFAPLAEFKAKHTYKWKKTKYHTDEKFKEKTREQAMDKYYRDKVRANAKPTNSGKGGAS